MLKYCLGQIVRLAFFILLSCACAVQAETLVAHWQMDETQWSGQNAEVRDSSGFENHGTAINGGSTTDALVCRGGWFRGEGYNADPNNAYYQARYYLRVRDSNNLSPQTAGANAAVTISGWFNTAISNGTILHKGEGNDTQEYRVFIEGSNLKLQIWNRFGGSVTFPLNYSISPGQWYFFAADAQRVGSSSTIRATLRLYGNNSNTMLASVSGQGDVDQTNKVTTGDLFIGAVSYGNTPTNYFDGRLDEIRVYAGLRTEAQVLADKNATRVCSGTLQCFTDDFQRDILGDNWAVTNKSGSFGNPRIVNGRLRITNNTANAATATTLQRLFPSEGNLVTLEYDFYAYGGNGADGMVVVFSDGNTTPEPGAFGGSLGYAQKGSGTDCPNCPGFAGGWLGLGLDTFGNYSNPTEGRLGGPGFRQNAIALRGSGVGQTGYRYISGTNSLSPAVRTGNSSTAHRYRITIDSRNPAHSWVTIARNTGNAFVTLIGPVDVLTSAGQAAVPQDLLLTLTGSTGGSNDIHEIDNVQVCAVKMNPIRRGINHFRISHSGTGLTCAAEPVRVLACANNDCSERFTGAVSLTMSPAAGWVGGAGYSQSGPTFNGSGGQFDLALRSSNAGSVDVKIDGSTPTAQNSTRCFRSGVEGSCQLTFTDIGIQLDGDSTDDAKSAIPTQITGKPSNIGHNSKQQRLRVIRANSTTGDCEAAVRDKTLDVQFRYNLPVAANGLADNKITISSGNNQQVLTTANTARSLPLKFDNQGNGYFVITSQDAGSYTLRADMNVPVTAPDGTELTASLARSDTSLPFIVRPLALYAHANGNNGATSAAGPAFRAAGDNFNLSLQAVSWQSGIDTNNDGQWDQCQLQDLTAPTVSPRLPAWSLAQQQPDLRVPAAADGGVAGTLKYDDNLSFSAGSSISNAARVNYSEVGIVQFDKTASFQGQSVQVCSGYIGRFYPADFQLSNETITPACGSFSYMQQPFTAGFTLTARNMQQQRTNNYTAAFASATAVLQAENNNNGVALTERLAGTVSPVWDRGVFSYLAPALRFKREIVPKEDGPYLQLAIAVRALDKDGVQIADRDANVSTDTDCKAANNCTAKQLAVTDIRYGRMMLKNAYGPEDENLPLSLNAEYWNGSRFMINTQDSCSLINTSNLTITGNFEVTTVPVASKLQQGQTPQQSFVLRAPNSIGTLKGEYVVPAWLQYNWSGKLSGCSVNPDDPTNPNCYDENPTAEFMFGRFRGNPRQIFWRELFP